MNTIISASIEPLKMGRIKGTNILRAIECRITFIKADGKKDYRFINTRRGGIMEAFMEAQKIMFPNGSEYYKQKGKISE